MNLIVKLATDHFNCPCRLAYSISSSSIQLVVYTSMSEDEFQLEKHEFYSVLKDCGFERTLEELSIIRGLDE